MREAVFSTKPYDEQFSRHADDDVGARLVARRSAGDDRVTPVRT